ncbi:hypothetical protein OPV22_031593 [Ensete ventricosum]|uniref:Uncharacterized protein n=1 Tax=Ensete ventricosum TaxID=4639 RepID=A0AAV8PU10_ENSVE|nr:hypothetical protein OPV22_031593 [Ensete ventricosum]
MQRTGREPNENLVFQLKKHTYGMRLPILSSSVASRQIYITRVNLAKKTPDVAFGHWKPLYHRLGQLLLLLYLLLVTLNLVDEVMPSQAQKS